MKTERFMRLEPTACMNEKYHISLLVPGGGKPGKKVVESLGRRRRKAWEGGGGKPGKEPTANMHLQ